MSHLCNCICCFHLPPPHPPRPACLWPLNLCPCLGHCLLSCPTLSTPSHTPLPPMYTCMHAHRHSHTTSRHMHARSLAHPLAHTHHFMTHALMLAHPPACLCHHMPPTHPPFMPARPHARTH